MDRRQFLQTGAAVGALGLAGCTGDGDDGGGDGGDGGSDGGDGGGGSDGGSGGGTQEITVAPGGDLVFEPAEVTVSAGTTVEWVWEGDFHTVTVQSQPDGANWEGTGEETHDTGFTHSHTFDVTGTYEYFCQPHRSQGMTGTLTVGSGDGGSDGDSNPTEGGGGDGGAY